MGRVLLGSRAILTHITHWRKPLDIDWLTDDPNVQSTRENDYHYHNNLDGLVELYDNGIRNNGLSLNELYTLKMSHLGWDIHWYKTVGDIIELRKYGVELIEDLYDKLVRNWEVKHGARKVRVVKGLDGDFFNDYVDRTYVHDALHEAIAYYDKPMYTKINNPGDVSVSRSKFEALSFDDKIKTVREEIYVLSLERSLIPKDMKGSAIVAYRQSLRLLTTKLTKGWFNKFIIDNIDTLFYRDKHPFREMFKECEPNITRIVK
jgi:hypothetical protein